MTDKEGAAQVLLKRRKWENRWIILVGGAIFLKKNSSANEAKGPYCLNGALIDTTDEYKKKVAAIISFAPQEGEDEAEELALGFTSEAERGEWVNAIRGAAPKKVGALPPTIKLKLSQSRTLALKKNLSGSVATSAGGKSIIKEFLGRDSVEVITIVKSLIATHEDKKKANEIENNIIKFGTKVILLWREKSIRGKDLKVCVPQLKELWTNLIHYCEIPFSYDLVALKKLVGELRDNFVKILGGKITEKNLLLLSQTMDYLVEEKMLILLFEDDDHEEMKKDLGKILRKTWAQVFKENNPTSSPSKITTTTTTTTATTTTTTDTSCPSPDKSKKNNS